MPASDELGPLRVEVLDGDEQPAVGIVVVIAESPSEHSDVAAITDGRGRVDFGLVPSGDYVLEAHAEDGNLARGTFVVAGHESTVASLRFGR